MNTVVQNFNLSKWVGEEKARLLLIQAGYRGHAPYVTYLFFRMVMPIAMLLLALFYVFVVIQRSADLDQARHRHRRRLFRHVEPKPLPEEQDPAAADLDQAGISRCARFAPDLHRIRNVGGGGVSKVSDEVGTQSVELAEEFTLTTAE